VALVSRFMDEMVVVYLKNSLRRSLLLEHIQVSAQCKILQNEIMAQIKSQ
jgi:hypothetical protein